jgi:hypothetical protein
MLERDMEDLIADYPDDFFPDKGFELRGRQKSFAGVGRFDLLFEDRHKTQILMELKAGPAKYEVATQLAKYKDELRSRGEKHILMWLVAPQVSNSVREFLDRIGIEYSEIHEAEFQRVAERHGVLIGGDTPPMIQRVGPVEANLGASPKQAEYRAWWTPVLQTKFDDPDQEPPRLYYPNNVRVALPWPNVWILAYRAGVKQDFAVTISGFEHDYPEMMRALTPQRDEVLSELPKGSVFAPWDDVITFVTKRKSEEFANDDEKRKWLSTTLNAYVNVLRPRLKQLVQSH